MTPNWNRLAHDEPYFAVLTHERFLQANLTPAAEREFFESGEKYVARVLLDIRLRVSPDFEPRNILEFGCGPGRLAIPFSRHARTVAVDRSPAMLAHAARNAERFGAERIEFRSSVDEQFDLINATFVLQQLPQDEGLALIRHLLDHLSGVGVFQVPVARHARAHVAAARWTRAHVPGLNAIANLAKHKPAWMPLLTPHVYDLADVLAVLRDAGCAETAVTSERNGDLEVATIYCYKPAAIRDDAQPLPPDYIDPRALIAASSMEQLNASAEAYFASLTDWSHHLAKPFSNADEASAILINFGTVLQGLRPFRGARVLEFGAGSGWLSRWLTQLGCEVTLLDVSAAALNIARELYARQPPIGDKPAPRFLVFDGRRIDLPDGSVDRIICFDAFHHAPNPHEMIAEFARVLAPHGIAAFAEPGPHHSRSPQSQFEMRTYGVIENDVDLPALWSAAQQAGFTDVRVAAFNTRPFHLPLARYDELLRGGAALHEWARWSRQSMKEARDFFFFKGDVDASDSRYPSGLSCVIGIEMLPDLRVRATVLNDGSAQWLPSDADPGGVDLGAHLYAAGGKLLDFEYHWQDLPRALGPGESVTFEYQLPPLAPGAYEIEFDCVSRDVAWFSQLRSQPRRVSVNV